MKLSNLSRGALILLTLCFGVVTTETYAQNKPAAEFQSLLNMRFYENNGGLLVENVQIVFPPAANQRGTLLITKASGE
jgi:hypothetical protein